MGTLPRVLASPLLGPVNPDIRLPVTVCLPLRNRDGLERLISEQADPASPRFMRYLSPEQFGDRFGPPVEQYARLRAYLESHGLRVTRTTPGRLSLHLEGAASRIESAFGVRLNNYRCDGRVVFANDRAPSLPAELGVDVLVVHGLTDALRAEPMDAGVAPFGPAAVSRAYNFDALRAVGHDGTGHAVAICSLADFSNEVVADYCNRIMTYASPPSDIKFDPSHAIRILIDGGNPDHGGEADLDTELCISTLPGARVLVYIAPNSNIGMYDIFAAFINDTGPNRCHNMTCSWGFTEPGWLPTYASYLDSFNDLLMEGAALGMTIFNSSGDNGSTPNATDSFGNTINGPSVSFPTSVPYMVSVGGTSLYLSSTDTYASEAGWGGTQSGSPSTFGSGGGLSSYFAKPSWQTGPGITADATKRLLPDVSLNADVNTGYTMPSDPGWIFLAGGTSCSAPEWACIAVLVQQGLGRPFYAPPILYRLFRNAGGGAPFHDVTSGNNGAYSCGPGFDLVTGIGSADVGALWRSLQALIGDADGNGSLQLADVVLLLKEAGGLETVSEGRLLGDTTDHIVIGDLNADGDITLEDAAMALRAMEG
jgi:kumamolisin